MTKEKILELRKDFLSELSNNKDKLDKLVEVIENALNLSSKVHYTIDRTHKHEGDDCSILIYSDDIKDSMISSSLFKSIKLSSLFDGTFFDKEVSWSIHLGYDVITYQRTWVEVLFIKVYDDRIECENANGTEVIKF